VECSRGECKRRISEIERWVRMMSKLTEVSFGSPFELVQRRQRSGCRTSERMRLEGETRKDMMMGE